MLFQRWRTSVIVILFLAIATIGVVAFSAPATLAEEGDNLGGQHGDELPQLPFLPLELAAEGAMAALESCTASGFTVSVTIVDAAGVVKVQARADGAGPHTLGSSDGKAYTAASLKRATLGLANFIADRPDLHGLRDMDDRILILGGGLPIVVNEAIVGGIGVGGAPGGDLDEACAQAGINAILAELD